MQWKNYRYNLTEEGVVITQYLSANATVDLLAGKEQSLLFGLEDQKVFAGDNESNPAEENYGKTGCGQMDSIEHNLPESEEYAVIPSHIDGHPVVEIGPEAFCEYGSLLTKVEVPPTVKRLGNGAFKMCMSLTELVLHDGLETIGEEVFYLTPMTELFLPATVSEITHPWEMGGIRFVISKENPCFSTDGFGLYYSPKSAVGKGELSNISGKGRWEEKELIVISSQDERTEYALAEGTTRVGENALAGNTFLRKVKLPAGVHTICEAAFEGCQNLEEIVLPEGLREIHANAFSHCICLKKLHLPSTVEKIGEHALSDTFGWSDSLIGLEQISVEEGNPHFQTDGEALFENTEDGRYLVKYFGTGRRYQIPGDVTRILPSAFRRAVFRSFSMPESVKDVGKDAFRECKNLEEIDLVESDTVLYVPRQPIYRKDEITALFCSKSREEMRKEEKEVIVLPEKWQAFARMPVYSRERESKQDPYERFSFDYRGYDALFHTYLNLPDHYGMALCRLKYPVMLLEDVRQKYKDFIRENLTDILESLGENQDMYHLAALAELGFFTEDNIEDCIDVFNRRGQAKLMSYLLNYKKEHLDDAEFDFSL